MYITKLLVQNFRALEDVTIEFDKSVSVIVGPNAAGKSTVLEAIRLAKAVLAPRTPNEAAQVLASLGATSPHIAGRVRVESIARNVGKDLRIRLSFSLSDEELKIVTDNQGALVRGAVQAEIGQPFSPPDNLIAFMSSVQGKQMTLAMANTVSKAIELISKTKLIHIELIFDGKGQGVSKGNAIDAQIVALLERRLAPFKTSFMYFPADRALPIGEQAVQLGSADAQQQMESYNSQPQLKFSRLKNAIFSAAVLKMEDDEDAVSISEEFEKIFSGVLKGRSLGNLGINNIGALGVSIRDSEGGRAFDIDAMSSGEKGLVLTCLLIARSVVRGGIVLLDEPELHLNPAVCKILLAFLVEQYVQPRGLQMIVCSHSPEILSGAFEREECALYHLVSSTDISRVSVSNEDSLDEAFRRLGASKVDSLLYKGIVYVEGPDDVNLLEAGFPLLLRRLKLKPTHGRAAVEKAVTLLKQQAADFLTGSVSYFILDNDGRPTELTSEGQVKILQWQRYCLENYFIDADLLPELLINSDYFSQPLKTSGEAMSRVKKIAFDQLDMLAAKKVYLEFDYEGLGLRKSDAAGVSVASLSALLATRLENMRTRLADFNSLKWQSEFIARVSDVRDSMATEWEDKWALKCDGKKVISDVCNQFVARGGLKNFKMRAMKEANRLQTTAWKEMDQLLRSLLNINS